VKFRFRLHTHPSDHSHTGYTYTLIVFARNPVAGSEFYMTTTCRLPLFTRKYQINFKWIQPNSFSVSGEVLSVDQIAVLGEQRRSAALLLHLDFQLMLRLHRLLKKYARWVATIHNHKPHWNHLGGALNRELFTATLLGDTPRSRWWQHFLTLQEQSIQELLITLRSANEDSSWVA
jgi:hypothetical protein